MKGVIFLLIACCLKGSWAKARDTHFAPRDTDLHFPQVRILNPVTVNTINIALRDTWFPRLRLSGQRKPVSCPGPPVLRAARAVSTSDRAWWMGTGFHCHEPALGKTRHQGNWPETARNTQTHRPPRFPAASTSFQKTTKEPLSSSYLVYKPPPQLSSPPPLPGACC